MRLLAIHPRPGLLPRLLGLALHARLRGSSRATLLLAHRLTSLQAVPITVNGRQTLFVDLREELSHLLLAGSPWPAAPWERDEQQVMSRLVRAGDRALDIGAHIGLHLVLLADLVGPSGRVHAFEPNPHKLGPLACTARHLPNATLHQFGLGDRAESATLFVPEDESMASLSDWTGGRGGRVTRSRCDVRRLDDLVDAGSVPRPDFVKCDVEGAELLVFRGGRRTLDAADAPIVLYEANAASARSFQLPVSAATDFLLSLPNPNYSLFHIQDGARLVPLTTFDPAREHFNVVAVPASKRLRMG